MVGVGFRGPGEEHGSKEMSSWDVLKGLNHLQNFKDVYYGDAEEDLEDGSDDIVEFVACGKQEVLDADMNYSLE